jgi:3-deoxy-D-manno-octulosonic-acid transferase
MLQPNVPMTSSTAAPADPVSATVAAAAYRLLGLALMPLMPLALSVRAARGKEDRARVGERFGRASRPRPAGRLAWVHAASVGETNAVMPLVDRIVAAGISVVFTSVTVTAANIAASRLPAGAVHQFSPIDVAPWIGRFLGYWRPDFALFVESELWPVTIVKLAGAGIPQILVNARMSERSFRGWNRFGGVARSLFSRIGLCLARTEEDGERYRSLGVPQVAVTGNLKFDVPPPAADPAAVAAFQALLGNRPVWVAASTHEGEEEIVAAAHQMLRQRHPGLVTIIVPRHPNRGPAIRSLIAARGLAVAQRSAGEPIGPLLDIYLADTLGELGLFYRVAPVAFLGGSLVTHGGQNPIEPVRLDAAILHGPHVHNFAGIYAALDEAGAAETIVDAESLAAAVVALLDDASALRRRLRRASIALAPFSGALDRTAFALAPYLAAPAGEARLR